MMKNKDDKIQSYSELNLTMKKPLEIGIATISEDIHSYAIQKSIQDRYQVNCHIIQTDQLANTGKISWSSNNIVAPVIPTVNTGDIDISQLSAVWWRRLTGNSQASYAIQESLGITDSVAIDIIISDCRASFLGIFLTSFKGAWVSHPDATRLFENKLLQLQLAQQIGLKIPQTLVSQNPQTIREFCAALNNKVIIKPLSAINAPVAASPVTDELLTADQSLQLCPAIYQEMIYGTQHLRINAFGEDFHTALITCQELDWRYNVGKSVVESYELPIALKSQLQEFLRRAGLRMGIFDMKIDLNKEPIWLEINPQGQFLFIEGLSDMKLIDAFADFLYREAQSRAI